MDLFTMEPMKYWSIQSTVSPQDKRMKLERLSESGNYLFGIKTDGNWSRAVLTAERKALQTRGISKNTGTYGEIQDKVFFWDAVVNAFQDGDTVILGEVYRDGDIDKDIGSVLRCLTPKARERQKNNPLRWRIFDVLYIDGQNLMDTDFEERIKYIPQVVNRINSPLVEGVEYYPMDDTFFDKMGKIFAAGGEGAVCYKRNAHYEAGKRGPHAWDSIKVKQEISSDIDCFILNTVPCEKNYNGGDIGHWQFWENTRTGEKLCGEYYGDYHLGGPYIPISKNYYYNWPASITVGVFDGEGNKIELCKVAGLTEEFKNELRDHFDDYYMCPVSINGMMVSTARENISIRHPVLKSIRMEDISPEDCTLEKILN